MENKAHDPNPPNSTPANPTSSSFFNRVINAFLLTTVLLAGYIWLHIPFSYLDANGRAATSISYWHDIIVAWLIAVIAALVIGRVSPPRWPRLVLLLISALILVTFILSGAELYYRNTNPEWEDVMKPLSWIEPFGGGPGIPSDLSDTIVSENFTARGIALSFLTAADTFRELNWYWIVVPIVDTEFPSFSGWLPIIELNLIFSMVLTLVGGATAVTATLLQDFFRLLYRLWRTLYNRISSPPQPYRPPYRAYRWSSGQKRLVWGAIIGVFLTSLTLFASATLANARVPHLTWETESIYIPSSPSVTAFLPLSDDMLLAGTSGGGIFRSDDEGRSWQAASAGLTNTYVRTLALEPQKGTLFAGTSEGVFRSNDGGHSWLPAHAGLTNTDVQVLALEPQEGTLFAGTKGEGVFRSDNGGHSWQPASESLSYKNISAFALEPQEGTLFAGTSEGGVFRSDDQGRSWQTASEGLSDTNVWALALKPQEGTLFAGTNRGVFRSDDEGRSWQAASEDLTNTDVQALALGAHKATLFASTNRGVFRSDDEGRSWQAASEGLNDTNVLMLALEPLEGTLFAGALGAVFRSHDEGRSWEMGSPGLTNTNVQTLVLGSQEGTLFTGTSGEGVLRSHDGGNSWEVASEGLTDMNVSALVLNSQDGTLFADTSDGVFRSSDGGRTWARANSLTDSSFVIDQGELIFSYSDLDSSLVVSLYPTEYPVPIAQTVALRSFAVQFVSEGEIELITAWGATLGRARLDIIPYTGKLSEGWLFIRGWVYRITRLFMVNRVGISLGFGGTVLLIILFTYAMAYNTWASAYNVSPLQFLLVLPWRSSKLVELARPALDEAWPTWPDQIRNSLLWWGDVIPADLRFIPRPYRRWALERYLSDNKARQSLDLRDDRLRLLAGGRPRMWFDAWAMTAGELHEARGLSKSAGDAVDRMAQAFGEALGLRLGEPHDWAAGRAYSVSAPALRLNVPPSFPLIFLADPRPNDETVKMLSDCVDVLRETGYFALVVPLEPSEPTVDIAAELQRWLHSSARVDDFIILKLNDVLDMLSARDPMAVLVKQIVAQVDLKTISPFQDSGPCPPNMFFGREREIKQIVEGVGRGDFAVVGNRKAGKTSLLQRVSEQLSSDSRFYPLLINCQTVPDTAGFCREFAHVSGLSLPDNSPEAFEQVVRTLPRADGLPILLLDEVDALLHHDRQAGEALSGTWRKLAQEGVCHFVFVGTSILAQRLRDPNSVFFNFPQRMPLKYLPQEVAELVIVEPMEMLGLTLQPEDEVLKKAVDLSSGHPNLLQTLGKRLVEQANDKQERIITLASCQTIAQSSDFTDFYLDLIWALVQPLEKLVTLVAPDEDFEVTDIERHLDAHDVPFEPEALDEALEMLQIYAILKRQNRQYAFNPTHFREIVQRTQDVTRLIRTEKRKLARQQEQS